MIALPPPQHRLADQRQALVALGHVRLMVLMLVLAAGFVAVIGRLAMLGILSPPTSAAVLAGDGVTRGDILDRNGAPLARTIQTWTVGVHPGQLLGDRRQIAQQLAAAMPEHDAAWYLGKLTLDANFTYLSRQVSPATVNQVHAIGEPGIVFTQEPQRLYPQTTLAAHVLGYLAPLGNDPRIIGRAGIERAFETRLTDPAERDTPLNLSIDSRVQAAFESELGHAMESFQARDAAGVLLDVDTGEVVAMVSLPVYNPNRVGMASVEALRNNVTQSVYELGSTFKPITMAAAIDTGTVTNMARRFDATHPLQIGRFRIGDEHDATNRFLDIPEILVHSSNIGTARVADELGVPRLQAMFRAMQFDQRPAIELRERAGTIWPSYWARTTLMTAGFGHGIAVTPLHLASAYAALVNGGMYHPATLLRVQSGQTVPGHRVISEATSFRMRQLLRLVVLQGTGRSAEVPGYRVGGKTGTAEIAQAGGYNHHANVSTFAAAFPMDHPRYVVIAMLNAPHANAESHGGTTAALTVAPVVRRVIMRTGAMLGVMPDMHRDIDVSQLLPLLWHASGDGQATPE